MLSTLKECYADILLSKSTPAPCTYKGLAVNFAHETLYETLRWWPFWTTQRPSGSRYTAWVAYLNPQLFDHLNLKSKDWLSTILNNCMFCFWCFNTFFRIFGSAVFIMGRGIDESYLPKQIEFHQIRYNIITKAVEYYVNSWTYEYISKFWFTVIISFIRRNCKPWHWCTSILGLVFEQEYIYPH